MTHYRCINVFFVGFLNMDMYKKKSSVITIYIFEYIKSNNDF